MKDISLHYLICTDLRGGAWLSYGIAIVLFKMVLELICIGSYFNYMVSLLDKHCLVDEGVFDSLFIHRGHFRT